MEKFDSQQQIKNLISKSSLFLSKNLTKKFLTQTAKTLAITASGLFLTESTHLTSFIRKSKPKKLTLTALPVVNPTVKYGFALDTFNVIEQKVKSDDIFTSMLTKRGLSYKQADSLSRVANDKDYYDFSKIQDGKFYTVLSRDVRLGYDYFIFEPDAKRYIQFDLKQHTVKEVKRAVEIKEFTMAGKVKSSLWETMVESGMSYSLADKVEDALKYKFDLRKFEDGDEYKLIWEEEVVEGRSVGVKCLKAVAVKEKSEDKPVYAYYFDNGKEKGFYEKDGLPMRDGFLKSPVKYSNITSHYSMNRMHPILGYNRPHFGTDYAAPHGTPILAVADGVVLEAQYGSGGNGNYVKLKHMHPYESQYLHMSRFAKGVSRGTHVKQGEVIGYVGSTGLATGPHVCFRFWKHGSQVNHLKEKLPQVSTFSVSDRDKFTDMSNSLKKRLDNMSALDEDAQKEMKKVFNKLRGKP
jgi:murein DD-endopeptidase MepM/ murein hydrolase activator NlpD